MLDRQRSWWRDQGTATDEMDGFVATATKDGQAVCGGGRKLGLRSEEQISKTKIARGREGRRQ